MKDVIDFATTTGIVLIIITYFLVYDKASRPRKHHAKKRLNKITKTFVTVIQTPQIWISGMIGLALYMPTLLFNGLWGQPYMVHVRLISPNEAGYILSLSFWGWIIGSPLAGWIAETTNKPRALLTIGAASCTALLYLIIYLPITDLTLLKIAMFALGIFSSTQILVFDVSTRACKRSHAGTAIAVTNMFVMLSGLLQIFVGGLIQDSSTASSLQVYSEEGFQTAFMLMPISTILATLLSLFIKEETNDL